mmetsp:Transcript_9168/g.23985  ORF Transcript_9168/g.23985 Transcript_9168/m.23985 type:complete len:206 (+) Transcript_9168:461-1078(+)
MLAELLDKPFSLVDREELGYAHANEGAPLRVLEDVAHAAARAPEARDLLSQLLLVLALVGERAKHLQHTAELVVQRPELREAALQKVGEAQEAQRVPCRSCVEDDDRVRHRLHVLHNLREAHGFVDAGEGAHELLHHLAERVLLLEPELHALVERRVDLHRVQVLEALHQRRHARELLAEGVADVVRRVGGEEEHGVPPPRELHG